MKLLGLIFFVYLTAINLTNCANISKAYKPRKLPVQVYYETLSDESMKFVRNQLYPAVKANDWLRYMKLEFIPYGKVNVSVNPLDNSTWLSCEHGLTECDFNALHACIVENNSVAEQLELINCLFKESQPSLYRCAYFLKIDVKAAMNCKDTRSNADILEKYGKKTRAMNITSVPSVALGKRLDPSEQEAILNNFTDEFCRKYTHTNGLGVENC